MSFPSHSFGPEAASSVEVEGFGQAAICTNRCCIHRVINFIFAPCLHKDARRVHFPCLIILLFFCRGFLPHKVGHRLVFWVHFDRVAETGFGVQLGLTHLPPIEWFGLRGMQWDH